MTGTHFPQVHNRRERPRLPSLALRGSANVPPSWKAPSPAAFLTSLFRISARTVSFLLRNPGVAVLRAHRPRPDCEDDCNVRVDPRPWRKYEPAGSPGLY